MTSLQLSMAIVALGVVLIGVLARWWRGRARDRAARLAGGVTPARLARDVSTRLSVEKSVTGGPSARGMLVGPAHLVLGADRFVVATHHGRVLLIDAAHPGEARCPGPRRLVIEGTHPSGATRVRVEAVVDDAEGWAAAISALSR